MISEEIKAQILRLHHADKWKPGTIARQLRIHQNTVKRVLLQEGVNPAPLSRNSMSGPYIPWLKEMLSKYPTLRARRLYEMAKERGYPGGVDHFRSIVARYRPSPPAEAYLRLRTLPGEQAQVDWAHFGKIQVGQTERVLSAFVMVLSSSRMLYLRFCLGQMQSDFLIGHQHAFEFFGGVPRVLLYDNLKSVVLERKGELIHFHPNLVAFSGHYRYEARPVAVGRGNEKGRVERAIQYVRHAFFEARRFDDVADLNQQALDFCTGLAAERPCPEDKHRTVKEAFEQERPLLLPLPDPPFPVFEKLEVHVGKTPYVRFDKNDYSVPHPLVQRTLYVMATQDVVRILCGSNEVAVHPRCYDAGQQIEDPLHIQALVESKRKATDHRGQNRLFCAVPEAKVLLSAMAQQRLNLGSATAALLRLLDHHGRDPMQTAVAEALRRGCPHPGAVSEILAELESAQSKPPSLPLALPHDPRVRDLTIVPHNLTTYNSLTQEMPDADDLF